MADDELPPDGLFYDSDDDGDREDVDPELSLDDLHFSDDELAAIRRLSVVPDVDEGSDAEVIAFRNSAGEPIVVPTDVATAAERAFRAYNLNVAGADWHTIALAEQYPSARAAKADVDRYLAEGRALVVEKSAKEMLTLEMARLNRYTFKLHDSIEKGSIAAITEARHLVLARARLAIALGASLTEGNEGGRTVVISGDQGTYVATLQEAAGNPTGPIQPDEGAYKEITMVTSSTSAATAAKNKDAAAKDEQETDLGIAEPANPQLPYTVEDSDGIERIVTVGDRAWTPPPSDPDPELVKAAKEREKKAKELAKKRQTPLGERKDEDEG